MNELDLTHHQPSDTARRRAEAAGLELERLKHEDPTTYAMLNAEQVMVVGSALLTPAGEQFYALFPGRQLFNLPSGGPEDRQALLAFPALSEDELRRLDEAFGAWVGQTGMSARHVYYRLVSDPNGERRELALPYSPGRWQGEAGVMVGPFATEDEASAWAAERVSPASGLVSDVLRYGEAWFCDIFEGE